MNKIKLFVTLLLVFGIVGVAEGNWTQDATEKECLAKTYTLKQRINH